MQSTVQLFNTALARLGGEQFLPLTSPQEDNALGALCANVFPHVLDLSLQAHAWGFAMRTAVLAPVAGGRAGAGGFLRRYMLPADCVRPVALEPEVCGPPYAIRGSAEGTLLLCDENPAVLAYVTRTPDPKSWPAAFADALAWGLAAELAAARINDAQRQQYYMRMYREVLGEAAAQDMREAGPRPVPSAWNAARFGTACNLGSER
ncbi:MAG: hypothetical protein LBP38_01225 [Desulfovibrio sp.]|jgi:hypothetical protein|nr:hypothetical protein [Desulfovibrio sp.]